jgi:hypothetical protein
MRIAIVFAYLLLSAPLENIFAQEHPPVREPVDPVSLTNADLPQDISQEWRVTTWKNKTIIADGRSILLDGRDLRIDGASKSLSLPCSDIASITIMPAKNGFRNGTIAGVFLSSLFLFSPVRTPGYYIGTQKERSGTYYTMYGTQYDESNVTPGLSGMSALYVAGSAVLTGLIAHMLKPEPHMIALDGSESPEDWRRIVEEQESRIRLHSSISIVASGAQSTWKEWNEKYSLGNETVQSYYYSDPRPVMTNASMMRLLRLGYALTRDAEVGIAVQAEGIQRFYQEFRYARPGVPPQQYVRLVSQKASMLSMFATAQYRLATIPSLKIQLHGGGGVGLDFAAVDLYGYSTSTVSTRPVSTTLPAFMLFGSMEYMLDRSLSIGLTADVTYAGSLKLPAQSILDYDQRVILTIDEHSIPLASFGIGVSFSYGF